MPDQWHNVPFPPPPRGGINWPAFGCLACAISVVLMIWVMVWLAERMVDAVLAIQWPV